MASKTSKPFAGLFCPACGAGESLNVSVETLALECRECEATIERSDVDAMVAKWVALLTWIDAAK